VVPIPLALTAIQILFIDLGFEILVALSFAWEPAESLEGLMKLQPRQPVTDETIQKRRRQVLSKQKAGILPPPENPDNGGGDYDEEFKVPSRFRRYMHEIKSMFYTQYWIDLFFNNYGEVLVDSEVLVWAFVEAGIIECVGALVTFYAVLHVGFGLDIATAVSAQNAGGYFMPHSPDLTLSDGSILVIFFKICICLFIHCKI
jgi:sodium/potassium-transporting ATPase subunit alpha